MAAAVQRCQTSPSGNSSHVVFGLVDGDPDAFFVGVGDDEGFFVGVGVGDGVFDGDGDGVFDGDGERLGLGDDDDLGLRVAFGGIPPGLPAFALLAPVDVVGAGKPAAGVPPLC